MTALKPDRYGQGLSFPPRIGADGRLAWSSGEENVRESIRVILLTDPGDRLLRPGFGCGLRRFLFEPNTPTTRALIRERSCAPSASGSRACGLRPSRSNRIRASRA